MDGYLQTLGEEGTKYWKISRNLGIGLAALSAGVEGANYISYLKQYGYDWNVTAKVGLDLIMTGVGFLGLIGLLFLVYILFWMFQQTVLEDLVKCINL